MPQPSSECPWPQLLQGGVDVMASVMRASASILVPRAGQPAQNHIPGAVRAPGGPAGPWEDSVRRVRQVQRGRRQGSLQAEGGGLQRHSRYLALPKRQNRVAFPARSSMRSSFLRESSHVLDRRLLASLLGADPEALVTDTWVRLGIGTIGADFWLLSPRKCLLIHS